MILFLNSRLLLQTLNITPTARTRKRRLSLYLPKLLFDQFVVVIVYLFSVASIQRTSYEDVKPQTSPDLKHHIVRAYSKYDIEQGDVAGETTALFYTPTTTAASSQQQLFCPARARRLDIKRSRLNMGALSLGVIFFVGVTVGTYLLMEQGKWYYDCLLESTRVS
jgi:hypothetical protein